MIQDLSRLNAGESGLIQSIEADEALHHRLQALGFQTGKSVSVVRLGMTDVIMRRSDAAKIKIGPLL
jgi:ferrous iron transport protein A